MNAELSWPQIKDWRKQQRADAIARRQAVPLAQRRLWGAAISELLEAGFPMLAGMTVAFCWPFKGEFDARFAIRRWRERGATAALPVVVGKAMPLQFRQWWPGAPLVPGAYGIPEPAGTELVVPDAAIVPVNGFDGQGYRLGYGGGYFDRTLAVAAPRPLAIGVGFELARLPTIYPQAHDLAMDFVVTEAGIRAITDSRLVIIDTAECRARAQRLCGERRLPRRPAEVAGRYCSPPCFAGDFPGFFGETEESS